jgi:hypothetical protein
MYRNGGTYHGGQVIELDRHSRSQPGGRFLGRRVARPGELMSRRFLKREPGVGVDDHWVVVGLWLENCRTLDWTAKVRRKKVRNRDKKN